MVKDHLDSERGNLLLPLYRSFFFISSNVYTIAIESPLGCHATTNRSGPLQGSEGQPRETTKHQQGPIRAIFDLLKFQNHYVAPFFLLADPPNLCPISFI